MPELNDDDLLIVGRGDTAHSHPWLDAVQQITEPTLLKEGGEMTGDIVHSDTQSFPKIPNKTVSSGYVLVKEDAGCSLLFSSGSITISSNVFDPGDAVTIVNNSSGSVSVASSGVTTYLAGKGTTGTRKLSAYGIATILCIGSNSFIISGGGLE